LRVSAPGSLKLEETNMKRIKKFKTSKADRDKVNAWRAANRKAINAAAKEDLTLAAWREKHGVKVKHAGKPRKARAAAPATEAA
jgi:recombination DNA repair RAD52 pathway protein